MQLSIDFPKASMEKAELDNFVWMKQWKELFKKRPNLYMPHLFSSLSLY